MHKVSLFVHPRKVSMKGREHPRGNVIIIKVVENCLYDDRFQPLVRLGRLISIPNLGYALHLPGSALQRRLQPCNG